jgi:DNA polymerase III epsilon subunit-like protein
MNNHIMLDLETMALSPDAAILSIGAVRFDLDTSKIDTENGFYRPIFLESNIESGRRISQGTLEWWLKQSPQAQEVFTDLRRIDLDTALILLANWIGTTSDGSRDYVWSNGADFDLPILVHAYTSLGIEIPWPSYSGRCYRTYKKLPYADTVVLARDGTRHLCAIHHKLFDGASV